MKTSVYSKTCVWMFTAALFVIVKRSPSMHKALNKLWHFILMNISQRPKGKNMDAHNTEEYPISWELHRVKSKSRKVGKIVWLRSHDIPLGTIFYPRGRLAGAEEGRGMAAKGGQRMQLRNGHTGTTVATEISLSWLHPRPCPGCDIVPQFSKRGPRREGTG